MLAQKNQTQTKLCSKPGETARLYVHGEEAHFPDRNSCRNCVAQTLAFRLTPRGKNSPLGAFRLDAYGRPRRAGQVQAAAGAAERLGLDAREHRGTLPGPGVGLLFRRLRPFYIPLDGPVGL